MVCILFVHTILYATQISIERYVPARDETIVKKIFIQYPALLTYEALGYKEGTTLAYLNSKDYITDVIRVDGTTIGFINYIAFNIEICTFHVGRRGFIHLLGIEDSYQHKGYGGILLEHALIELKKLHVPVIEVSVQSTNIPALKLYEKKGFKQVFTPSVPQTTVPLVLRYEIDIPKDLLPQGNWFQRHPLVSKAALMVSIAGYISYKLFLTRKPGTTNP